METIMNNSFLRAYSESVLNPLVGFRTFYFDTPNSMFKLSLMYTLLSILISVSYCFFVDDLLFTSLTRYFVYSLMGSLFTIIIPTLFLSACMACMGVWKGALMHYSLMLWGQTIFISLVLFFGVVVFLLSDFFGFNIDIIGKYMGYQFILLIPYSLISAHIAFETTWFRVISAHTMAVVFWIAIPGLIS